MLISESDWPSAKIETRKVLDLKPYQANSRVHPEHQIDQLVESIKAFGLTRPILISEDNTIIAGHGCVSALKKMGAENCDVVIATGWAPEQIRAYVIADNQLNQQSFWDFETLKFEIEQLQDVDFDLDLLGFDDFNFLEPKEGPDEFPEYDEKLETKNECPSCGYRW